MIIKRRRVGVQQSLPPAKKPAIPAGFLELQSPSPPHQPNLKMVVAVTYYPKPNPHKPQGDDSHFICVQQQTVGVADGVGCWARSGIDAGKYARDLMLNAAFSVLHQPQGSVNPRTVLNEAFHNTKTKGSSTACIATLKHSHNHHKHSLHAVNVGDSGFMLFRNKQLLFQSPTQQHRFNKPYEQRNSKKSDKPEKAVEFEVEVMAGEIVVFGTDGVFDNVYPREIARYIELNSDGERVEPEELAWIIAEVALCNSKSRRGRSPFAEVARKAGKDHVGGKIDDITVLVAHIVPC